MKNKKQITTENSDPSGYYSPGKVFRRPIHSPMNPMKKAIKMAMKKGDTD